MKASFIKSGAALALACAASVGWAAPNSANQQGSLLIYPLIVVGDNTTTVIQIGNDWSPNVTVKCFFMDEWKTKVDMEINLTKYQSLAWDASTGLVLSGGQNVPGAIQSFPGEGYGLLACWAVQNSDNDGNDAIDQINWNHLFGKATVYDLGNGESSPMAIEYSAVSFRALQGANGALVGTPGQLLLNNVQYDACSTYIKGQFQAPGSIVNLKDFFNDDHTLGSVTQFISVASCALDFRNNADFLAQKLEFDIWSADEVKKTGTDSCADSYFWYYLGDTPQQNGDTWGNLTWRRGFEHTPFGWKNFLPNYLGSDFGYYRLSSKANAACDNLARNAIATFNGLTGVQGGVYDVDPAAPWMAQFNDQSFVLPAPLRSRIYGDEAAATNTFNSNSLRTVNQGILYDAIEPKQ